MTAAQMRGCHCFLYLYGLKTSKHMMSLVNQYELAFGQMPFEPDDRQVVFVDNGLNRELNDFIMTHIWEIKRIFEYKGLDFCYIPAQMESGFGDIIEQIRYRAPWADAYKVLHEMKDIRTLDPRHLFEGVECRDGQPALVGNLSYRKDCLSAFKIDVSDTSLLLEQFRQIAHHYSRMVENRDWNEGFHDRDRDPEMAYALEIIRRRRPTGALRQLIEEALSEGAVLSPLVIDSHYDLVLPKYNGMTIHLRPMEKTVYFLYLRHPEGIAFKDISDHAEEIGDIYGSVTKSSEPDTIYESVSRLTDPMRGSLDTQRSRITRAIKNAFVTEFDESLAQNYIISGKAGEPMRITLPRDLVEWQCRF